MKFHILNKNKLLTLPTFLPTFGRNEIIKMTSYYERDMCMCTKGRRQERHYWIVLIEYMYFISSEISEYQKYIGISKYQNIRNVDRNY